MTRDPRGPREPRWRRYLRFFGTDPDADVDDELRFHLDARVAEYERLGMSRADAERAAGERFGDAARIAGALRAHDRRRARRLAGRERMLDLRQDLRFAVRALRQAPGWTAGVVLTLALGIGLATAVYTVADALLLRRLPVHDQDRLVTLWGITPDGRTDHFPLLLHDAREYARTTKTLERAEFFSFGGAMPVAVRLGDGLTRLSRSMVSGGYFDLLGARPILGRALRPDDDVRGAPLVAVLSDAGWRRGFGGDPRVVGRRLELPELGKTYTIVGVMPPGLDYPKGVDLWVPVIPSSGPLGDQPVYAELLVLGRLRRGATPNDARAEMTRFFQRFAETSGLRDIRGVAHPLVSEILGDAGPAVVAFAAAAGLLLLITCINVANLLLVRGLGRVRELAVRSALGAGRGRLVRQLLTESALLALGGGLAGALLAVAAVRGFVALAPAGTPRLDEIRVGASVLAGATGITALATLLFALAPTLVSSRVELVDALRTGSRQSGGSRRFRLGTEALVAGQVALALLVLSAAGLVGRSLLAMEHVDLALDPSRLLVVDLTFPLAAGGAKAQVALLEQLVPRLEAVRGVRAATPVLTPPFAAAGGVFGRGMRAEEQSADDAARNPTVDYEPVMPNFFATFGVPLVRGRLFTDGDREGTPAVIVIGESLARSYWPGQDPIGKRLDRGDRDYLTVVGVVRDARYRDLRDPRPRIYLPLRQSFFPSIAPTTLVVAGEGRPGALAPAVRRAVSEAGLGIAVAGAAPFETYLDGLLAQPRLNALLLALFAGAALSLAAVGLFGVMATAVRQRTREIGVRMALGATPSLVRRAVLGRSLVVVGVGAALGLLGALASTRALRVLLFGVSPTDAPTLVATSLVLLGVALLAAQLPARRAARIDPAQALRAE